MLPGTMLGEDDRAALPESVVRVLTGEARWAVERGDGFELVRRMPIGAVDHTIADPPYDDRTSRGARTFRGAIRTDDAVANDTTLGERFVSFDGMQPAAVLGAVFRVTQRWSLLFCALEQLGAYQYAAGEAWIRAGVWHRMGGAPQFSGDRPAQGAEGIAILHAPGRKRWNGGGHAAFWECPRVASAGRPQGEERVHPTQKPIELVAELVELFTDPDDVVLDPFCGSGTTGVACVRRGRRFIGFEVDPLWAILARARLVAEERDSTFAALRAGQQALFGGGGRLRGGDEFELAVLREAIEALGGNAVEAALRDNTGEPVQP